MRPVGHGPDLPVPILSDFEKKILSMSSDASSDADVKHDNEFQCSRARDQHWSRNTWPTRKSLTPEEMSIVRCNFVESSNILLPPLHIKLGLMKQFVKALPKDGQCFQYLCDK